MIDKEDNLINTAIKEGDEIFFKILDEHPVLDEHDPRRTSIVFSIMTNCIVHLHMMGWSEQQLVNEVFDHCEIARRIAREDSDE
jgi:hypothetical protein